jgi:hypothetical protein
LIESQLTSQNQDFGGRQLMSPKQKNAQRNEIRQQPKRHLEKFKHEFILPYWPCTGRLPESNGCGLQRPGNWWTARALAGPIPGVDVRG